LSAADSGSDAGSMDAEARMSRGESRKRCGESARQLSLAASRSPRRCDFALYPVSYCSWLNNDYVGKRIAIRSPAVSGEWKSNQGTKSDRELPVRGDPWAVSVRRVRPRLTELYSKIATQAAIFFESGRPAGRARVGEGRVGDRLEPTVILLHDQSLFYPKFLHKVVEGQKEAKTPQPLKLYQQHRFVIQHDH
jgi:hypothetical protein